MAQTYIYAHYDMMEGKTLFERWRCSSGSYRVHISFSERGTFVDIRDYTATDEGNNSEIEFPYYFV